MFTVERIPLMASLFSEEAADEIMRRGIEKELCAAAKFVLHSAHGAVEAFTRHQFKLFDANPGDSGCQNRAIVLRELEKSDLSTEFRDLLDRVSPLLKKVQALDSVENGPKMEELVDSTIRDLSVSNELAFLIHSFVSTKMKAGCADERGVRKVRSEESGLCKLSKQILVFNRRAYGSSFDLSCILNQNQKVLSRMSLEGVAAIASRIQCLPDQEAAAMRQMLSPERRRVVTTSHGTRSFGFQFATLKTLLTQLRQTRGTICFMSIVPKGERRFHLFLRSPDGRADFEVIAEEMAEASLVAFESLVRGNSQERAEEAFRKHGFSTLMLAQAAYHTSPFGDDPKETLASADLPDEVLEDVKRVPDVGGDLFELDHLFFAAKEEVLKMHGEQVL